MINEERRKIQQEALDAIENSGYNGIFLLPTGTGKSWVLIESLKRLLKEQNYGNIWYLCNSRTLRDTDFKNELKLWGAEDLIDRIQFMCYHTAYKLEDQKVDILIADEFDYSLTPKYSEVYRNNTFTHKILTTAYIDKDKLQFIDDIAPIVYATDLKTVESSGVLNKSKYFFVNYKMYPEESREYLAHNKKISDYIRTKDRSPTFYNIRRLEFAIRERKQFLNSLNSSAAICRRLMTEIYKVDKECKILTFCELTKQTDKICKYSYHTGSDQTNLEKFRNSEIQALAVCGKVNRGVNIVGINNIIFESCNQSKTQIIQRLGRGKRLKENEQLNVYFLIPYYDNLGSMYPTQVKTWVDNATAELDLSNKYVYNFKKEEK